MFGDIVPMWVRNGLELTSHERRSTPKCRDGRCGMAGAGHHEQKEQKMLKAAKPN